MRLAAVFLALGAAAAWYAPTLLWRTGLLDPLIRPAFKELNGSVHFGEASLGWLSPVELRNVQFRDGVGVSFVDIPTIRVSKSLAELFFNPHDLGKIRLEQPVLHVLCNGPGTNVEKVFAAWLKPSTESLSPAPTLPAAFEIDCVGGSIEIDDAPARRSWRIGTLNASVHAPRRPDAPLTLVGSATLAEAGSESRVQFDFKLLGEEIDAKLELEEFPLSLAGAVLRRSDETAQLDGKISIKSVLKAGAAGFQTEGRISAWDVTASGIQTAGDELVLRRLDLPWKAFSQGGRIYVDQAQLDCDFCSGEASGAFDATADTRSSLRDSVVDAKLDVDVAKIATMLPHVLHLHEGTRLQSGRVSASLQSKIEENEVVLRGKASATGLQATRNGKQVAWESPVRFAFVARQGKEGPPVFDALNCRSDFLTVDAKGSAEALSLSAAFDLGLLSDRLGRFIDLGAIRLAGAGSASLAADRDNDRFRLKGRVDLDRIDVVGLTPEPFYEDAVVFDADVAGDSGKAFALNALSGRCRLFFGADGVNVHLLDSRSTALTDEPTFTSVRVRAVGDLERWKRRASTFVPGISTAAAAGKLDLDARIRSTDDAFVCDQVALKLIHPRIRGLGLCIDEEKLVARGAGTWTPASRKLQLHGSEIACETMTVAMPLVAVDLSGSRPLIDAKAAIQGDLARLCCWFSTRTESDEPNQDAASGTFRGDMAITSGETGAVVTVDLKAENATFGPAAKPTWTEPSLRLAARATLQKSGETVTLDSFRVQGEEFALNATGSVARYTSTRDLALSGQIEYQLDKAEPQLRLLLGQTARVSGRERRGFTIAGPLGEVKTESTEPIATTPTSSLVNLSGDAGFGWRSFSAYGANVDAVDLQVKLNGGWLLFEPIESRLNQGRFQWQPHVRLAPGPLEVRYNSGVVIDHAQITPAMCASAIGYIVPAIAKVAEAEGEISVELTRAAIPFAALDSADAAGAVVFHSVTIGPSPIVQKLRAVVGDMQALPLAKEMRVPFRLRRGRVYHEDFQLDFPGATVTTSGSVGLDGSLDLLADFSFRKAGRRGDSAEGGNLRIPVGGTLTKPHLDERAIRAALTNSAKDAVKKEIGRKLQKLFD